MTFQQVRCGFCVSSAKILEESGYEGSILFRFAAACASRRMHNDVHDDKGKLAEGTCERVVEKRKENDRDK